jgi:Ca2+-binding RTX toxin-like protein
MRPLSVLALSLGLVLASAATATASTATVSGNAVILTGGDEANAVEVGSSTDRVIIEDKAGITPGAGCEVDTAYEAGTAVICGDPGTTVVQASLGAGDDKLSGLGFDTRIGVGAEGGPGADDLQGGSSSQTHDVLDGGPGDDKLSYADEANGGDGADIIFGSNDDDVLHGDSGVDTVSGGSRNDQVYGDEGDDSVNGDSEDDLVDGGPGQDKLNGDSSSVYAGNDTLNARDGERDQISCNFGADIVEADQLDAVEGSGQCEQVDVQNTDSGDGAGDGDGPAFDYEWDGRISRSALLKHGVELILTLQPPVHVTVALAVTGATANKLGVGHKTTILGGADGDVDDAALDLRIRPFKRFRKKLKRAGKFTALLLMEVSDSSGSGSEQVKVKVQP